MTKKFFASILLVCILSCSAYADLVYTTDNGVMGLIEISSSLNTLSVDSPVQKYSGANDDAMVAHFYNEDGTSLVALIEPETDTKAASGDAAYIFNASDLTKPIHDEAKILTGVYDTNSTAYSGNHRSIYFASGVNGKATLSEFNTSSFEFARSFSYITSDDDASMSTVLVNGESVFSLATHATSRDSLFYRFDGQIDNAVRGSWSAKAKYDSELMTFGSDYVILAAHSGGVDRLNNGKFDLVISTDTPVKALCRDKDKGFYFITQSDDTGRQILKHYKSGSEVNQVLDLLDTESDSLICQAIFYGSDSKKFVAVIMNDSIIIYNPEDDSIAGEFTSSDLGGIPTSITSITQNTSSSNSSSNSHGCNITGAGILLILSAGYMLTRLTRKRKI